MRLALVDVAVALALSPLTVRGYGVVSVGGGHRPRHAFLVVAHAVGGRGLLTATALSVEALGRVVPGLDPRIDVGHAVTALGVGSRGLLTATAPALSVRVPMPVGGCGAVVRDRPLSRIARGQACVLPASPARLRSVEAGRLARRGPQEGVEAFVSPPPVAWSSGGRPSCSGGASIAALPSVFAGACQVLHGLVWLLFPGSTWSLGGCDRFCSSVGGCRVPVFACCWGGHFLCATVTPAGAGVLPAAPAAGPGGSGDQQRQGMSRSRGRCCRSSGDGSDGRA